MAPCSADLRSQLEDFKRQNGSGARVSVLEHGLVHLYLPWCLKFVHCALLFDTSWPSAAPDVLSYTVDSSVPLNLTLPAPDAKHDPNAPEAQLARTLQAWDGSHPAAITNLELALRQCYLHQQGKRLLALKNDRLEFEYDTMRSVQGLQLMVSDAPAGLPRVVTFAVPLSELDTQSLRASDSRGKSGPDQRPVVLYAAFSSQPHRLTPEVVLHAPPWITDECGTLQPVTWRDGGCLAQYIPEVVQHVQLAMDSAAGIKLQRKLLLVELSAVLGPPLELDTRLYSKAMYTFLSAGMQLLLYVAMPNPFPRTPPSLEVHSLGQQGDATLHFTDISWSPHWHEEEAARRILGALRDRVAAWKAAIAH